MDEGLPEPDLGAITRALAASGPRTRESAEELLPLVYDQLRRMAKNRLERLAPGQTIQATALVHEAWMRVAGDGDPGWDGRAHFVGAAARAMRNILVDRARRKGRVRHGGAVQRVESDFELVVDGLATADVLAVHEALERLEHDDARKARVVELRVFGGLTMPEIAATLGIAVPTVERDWRFARAWLGREIGNADPQPPAQP